MIEIKVNKIPNSLDAINNISFSKSFKRLSDKTQMIETRISEHYRTRLTHTLEVMTIANTICDRLNEIFRSNETKINIDKNIVLATALAHDLGHTPYGHIGEQTINKLLKNTGFLFKHNVNSVKILLKESIRETGKPAEIYSPNLDWQIIDGVLKHTKVFPKDYKQNGVIDPYNLEEYFNKFDVFKNAEFQKNIKTFLNKNIDEDFLSVYLNYPYSLTLTGQIIAVADEIAQRISDFDDTIRILKKRKIKRISSTVIFNDLVTKIKNVKEKLEKYEDYEKGKTYKSTLNYCDHMLRRLKLVTKEEEISLLNIANRTQNFYIENLIENIKNKIDDIEYEELEIKYIKDDKNETVKYYLIKPCKGNQFLSFDKPVEEFRNTMSNFSYENVHNSEEIRRGNDEGTKNINRYYNECINNFELCDNNVKNQLLNLYSKEFGKKIKKSSLDDAFNKYKQKENEIYNNKCELIILEGISYMSNNYLADKLKK